MKEYAAYNEECDSFKNATKMYKVIPNINYLDLFVSQGMHTSSVYSINNASDSFSPRQQAQPWTRPLNLLFVSHLCRFSGFFPFQSLPRSSPYNSHPYAHLHTCKLRSRSICELSCLCLVSHVLPFPSFTPPVAMATPTDKGPDPWLLCKPPDW